MTLTFRPLHQCFAAEVSPVDLRTVHDQQTLAAIRAGMDEYAVLVVRDQPFTDAEQLAFAQRLDGELHTRTGASVLGKSRLGNEAVADISNLNESGEIIQATIAAGCTGSAIACGTPTPRSRTRRAGTRCSRRKVVPPAGATPSSPTCGRPTTRWPAAIRPGSTGSASITRSRTPGRRSVSSSPDEEENLKGAVHPLVRTIPRSGAGPSTSRRMPRGSSTGRSRGAAPPPGSRRARDPARLVYRHVWRVGDLVIWDNRATMHRARPFDDATDRRELRRVTTLDISRPAPVARGA